MRTTPMREDIYKRRPFDWKYLLSTDQKILHSITKTKKHKADNINMPVPVTPAAQDFVRVDGKYKHIGKLPIGCS